jgi:hypothetical protein
MYIVVVGRKEGETKQTVSVVSLDHRSKVRIHSEENELRDHCEGKDITAMTYSQSTNSIVISDGSSKLWSLVPEISKNGLKITRSESSQAG